MVAWISDSDVVLQKLDPNGSPLWGSGVVLSDRRPSYSLADLHATEKGSVIVSWVRVHGLQLALDSAGNQTLQHRQTTLGNATEVQVFDSGSLQFGEFPYFIPDGSGGAVFSWYSNSPTFKSTRNTFWPTALRPFPHNGSVGSNNLNNVHVSPTVSYRASTSETFLFWTEEDSNQVLNGVYGQKFDSTGAQQWGSNGLAIVPLGSDQQLFVQSVQTGTGAQVFWVDEPNFDQDTMNAFAWMGREIKSAPPSRCRPWFRASRAWRQGSVPPACQRLSGRTIAAATEHLPPEREHRLLAGLFADQVLRDAGSGIRLRERQSECEDHARRSESRWRFAHIASQLGRSHLAHSRDSCGVFGPGTRHEYFAADEPSRVRHPENGAMPLD